MCYFYLRISKIYILIIKGFGRADHSIAVKLLNQKYAEYSIEFSNEGY